MRDITFKQDIDPDSWAPVRLLYVGDQFAGVKLDLEYIQDMKILGANMGKLLTEFSSKIEPTVRTVIPDVTDEELAVIYDKIGLVYGRSLA